MEQRERVDKSRIRYNGLKKSKSEKMKKLPIGIAVFRDIIEENYIYIDKTKYAYELITNYKYTFLSRPRRFGKSLFLDTLQEIFEGNQKLFKGLYIYDKWDWNQKYPVINLKLNFKSISLEDLDTKVIIEINKIADRFNLILESSNSSIMFSNLIYEVYKKYQVKVVILIDDWDKPIRDNLIKSELNIINKFLLSFYIVTKDMDRYIHFMFATGEIPIKGDMLFGFNHLYDISLIPKFGNICGYTQNDIEITFKPYLKGADLEELKKWYNGYNFLSEKVYNPFDILLFIRNNFKFKNYWFDSGTPNFLIKLFKQGRYNLASFENLKVKESFINAFDIDRLNLETVMFQSGYLTINKVIRKRLIKIYQLQYPNIETKLSFNNYILNYLIDSKVKKLEIQNDLIDILEIADLKKLETTLKALFASIAYNNFTNNYIQNYEGFYASVIYAYFAGAGFDDIRAEDVTSSGRIDLSVFIDDKVYIFEFKVDSSGALEQIKEKKYYQKYIDKFNEIYLIGVEFDSESRNLIKYSWERIK